MFIPPPSNPNAKLGFSTYAMWALCVVVVGVCYKLEQNELAARPASPAGIPDTVQKVMPSGAWLMSAPRPSAFIVVIPLMRHTVVGRGRLDPEGQLNRAKLSTLPSDECLRPLGSGALPGDEVECSVRLWPSRCRSLTRPRGCT